MWSFRNNRLLEPMDGRVFTAIRDETAALTGQTAQIERDAQRMSAWRGCMG